MFPLQVITVGAAGASSVTFTNIPNTYTHLQIRAIQRNVSTNGYTRMQFNNDTASNYSVHYLDGDGASALAGGTANNDHAYFGYSGTSSNSSIYGVAIVDILDYANTNKYKTSRTFNGIDVNGSGGYVELGSSSWRSTSAITSIKIAFGAGTNFAQYSQFALYGVKTA